MPDGRIDTKLIEHQGERRDVRWIRRNAQGQVITIESVAGDTYDPRVRPWYLGAVDSKTLFWTDVYVFFTDQAPGITAALPILQYDQVQAVFGLDIELKELSAFLASLAIGQRGLAMILDRQGRLVAYPKVAHMLKKVGGTITAQSSG